MKVFKKQTVLLSGILAALMLAALCSLGFVRAETVSVDKASRLFTVSEGMKLSDDRRMPAGAVDDARKGLQLESVSSEAFAATARPLTGPFELDFRVPSETTGVRDVAQLFVTVTDADTGRFFTWRIDARAYLDFAHTSLFVDEDFTQSYAVINGERTEGPDGVIRGSENNAAAGNRIYHTVSFCNYLEADAAATSGGRSVSGHLRFDPATMEAMVLTQNQWYRVADMDDPDMMRYAPKGVLTGFERYNVTLRMELAAPQSRSGKLIVYALNGQSLASPREGIYNTAGPDASVKADDMAVRNMPYVLPTPVASDVIDGPLTYIGTPVVRDAEGGTVAVTNGTITPAEAGTYTIEYPLQEITDKAFIPLTPESHTYYNGAKGEYLPYDGNKLKISLEALAEHPGAADITVEGSVADFAARGEKAVFPSAYALNPLARAAGSRLTVGLTIEKEGAAEPAFACPDVSAGAAYTFTEDGRYTVVYAATDKAGVTSEKSFTVDVSDAYPVFSVPAYSDTVKRGESFTIPDVTAAAGQSALTVTSKIVLPDGTETSEKTLTAVYAGDYAAVYTCQTGGKTFTKTLTVRSRTDPGSLFTAGKNMKIASNVDGPAYAGRWDEVTPFNGIRLEASGNNATAAFNNVIDLSKSTTERPLVEYVVTPEVLGKYEFSSLTFRFTDVYDSENYLDINVIPNTSREYEYASLVKASVKGNTLGGMGWSGAVGTASYAGTDMTSSFHGTPVVRDGVPDRLAHSGRLYYDDKTRTVYCDHTIGTHGKAEEGLGLNMVNDLDDPDKVGAGKEWNGFTTGEVTLTVIMSDLTGKSASLLLLTLDGIPLSGESVSSGRSPLFVIDKKGETAPPDAQVGKPYPVYPASVKDVIDGELPYRAAVWYDYAGEKRPVTVTNGAFTPDRTGEYTIEYTSGAYSRLETLEAVERLDPLVYTFDAAPASAGPVGQRVYVPSGTAKGGSGVNKAITTEVTRLSDGRRIETIEDSFLPMEQGTYRVKVTAADFLGQTAEAGYDVKITFARKPVITKLPSIPKAIQIGARYVFPAMEGIDYFSDKTAPHTVTASVTVNGLTLGPDRAYTPEKAGTLTAVYRLSARFDDSIYEEKTFTVEAYDFTGGYKEKYFYPSGTFKQIGHTQKCAFFEPADGDASLFFANPLLADSFSIGFTVPSAETGGVEFVFTDAENSLIAARVSIVNEDGGGVMYVNGARGGRMGGAFGSADKSFLVTYSADDTAFRNKSGADVGKVTTSLSSELFTGFTSGKFYVEISLIDPGEGGRLEISDLSGQAFNDMKTDRIAPQIEIDGKVPLSAAINAVVSLPYAVAGDVLTSESSLFVTVSAPGGVNVIDKQPVAEGMSFRASSYGSYVITYEAYDSRDNADRKVFTLLVSDKIPPTVRINGALPAAVKVGSAVTLPPAEVTDNVDEELKLYVFVLDPTGRMTDERDLTYTPAVKGTYTVYYYAKDSSFSYCCRALTFTAE